MKINRLLAAPLVAAVLLSTSRAFAQPSPLNAPMIAGQIVKTAPKMASLDEANWRAIRVQNVRPSMIAYQLDSAHNKVPSFWNLPSSLSGLSRQKISTPKRVAAPAPNRTKPRAPKGPFDLPDGVKLAASDEQNLLFVAGADAAQIAHLQELVNILDQPLRSVEIEAQIVELPAEDIKQFGIDFSASRGNFDAATKGALTQPIVGMSQIGFVRNNFQDRLNALANVGKAKVLSTKPLTIINNGSLAVSLRSGPIDNTGANQNQMPLAPKDGSSDTIITLTPTINGDDTVTVLMGVAPLPKTANSSGLLTVVNVRDGDTIALDGLRAPLIPTQPKPIPLLDGIPIISGLFASKKADSERTTLVFVIARIVR